MFLRLVWSHLVAARMVGDVVLELHRVGRLVVDDGVDGDHHVVPGDDLLGRHIDDLLAHVHPADRSTKRHDERSPGSTMRSSGRSAPQTLLELVTILRAGDDDQKKTTPTTIRMIANSLMRTPCSVDRFDHEAGASDIHDFHHDTFGDRPDIAGRSMGSVHNIGWQ